MVAQPHILTPEDGTRLLALIRHSTCFIALAQHSGIPLDQILNWAALPHIRHAIDTLDRAAALQVLRETIRTAQNPVEKRRAAATILRVTSRAADRPSDRSVLPRATDRCSEPSVQTPPALRTPPHSPIARAPQAPAPMSPDDLVDHQLQTLKSLQHPTPRNIYTALAPTIHPRITATPSARAQLLARIASSPLPAAADARINTAPATVYDNIARKLVTFHDPRGRKRRCTFFLEQDRANTQRWLLTTITDSS